MAKAGRGVRSSERTKEAPNTYSVSSPARRRKSSPNNPRAHAVVISLAPLLENHFDLSPVLYALRKEPGSFAKLLAEQEREQHEQR